MTDRLKKTVLVRAGVSRQVFGNLSVLVLDVALPFAQQVQFDGPVRNEEDTAAAAADGLCGHEGIQRAADCVVVVRDERGEPELAEPPQRLQLLGRRLRARDARVLQLQCKTAVATRGVEEQHVRLTLHVALGPRIEPLRLRVLQLSKTRKEDCRGMGSSSQGHLFVLLESSSRNQPSIQTPNFGQSHLDMSTAMRG